MNINTSSRPHQPQHRQRHAGLHVRLRQQLRDRGAAGRAADRPQLAAALRLRALCRATLRFALHRAARQQRALVALSHPAVGEALRPLRQGRCPAVAHRAVPRGRAADRATALGSGADSERGLTFLQGVQTMTTAGDVDTQAGMAAHVYLITKSMVDQHFYNADGEMLFVPQQGNLRFVTEFGRIDVEPGEIAGDPARREVPGRASSRPARAAISARTMAAPSRCRSAARSAPTASPMRAISSRRSPPMRTRTRRPSCS